MVVPPEVRFSILRNNVEIPLIPIDQLPFTLKDLPSRLDSGKYGEQVWKLIGETRQPTFLLSTEPRANSQHGHSTPPTKTTSLAPDHIVRKRSATGTPKDGPTSKQPVRVYSPIKQAANPSGIQPDPSKKKYCTHWIRHNSCDYMQQGCRYKHEMPDREKLKELGFPQIPSWYRDKMAISAGASSWLRPCTEKSDTGRQLSTEPPTLREPRVITLQRRHGQLNAAETPRSTPKLHEVPDDIPNLIDLDDLTFETQSVSAPPSKSRIPDAISVIKDDEVISSTKTSFYTVASTLKQGAKSTVGRADASPDGVTACAILTSDPPGRGSSPSQLADSITENVASISPGKTGNRVEEGKVRSQCVSKFHSGGRLKNEIRSSKPYGTASRHWRPTDPSALDENPFDSHASELTINSEPTTAQLLRKHNSECRYDGARPDPKPFSKSKVALRNHASHMKADSGENDFKPSQCTTLHHTNRHEYLVCAR